MDGEFTNGMATELWSPAATSPRSPRRRFRIWGLLAFTLAVAWLGWRYAMPREAEGLVAVPTPLARTVSGPGLLGALVKVEVGSRVEGRIVGLSVEQGDVVRKGVLIARLDAPDTAQQLTQARADAEAALFAVMEAENDRVSAEAAFAHAQAEFDRKALLVRTADATRAVYDAARATMEQAAASLARSEAAVQHARSSEESARAAVLVVEARLADSTVLAPVDGVVSIRNHSVGDVLAPSDAIVQLIDPQSIIISARLDESAMSGIARGQSVEIQFTSFPDRILRGNVLRLGRSVDTTTREFTVDVTLPELPPHWAIGQRATVTVTTGATSSVMAVPESALAPRGGLPGVWIAANGRRAHWRQVQLGDVNRGLVEVRHGIDPGEIVLTHPAELYAWEPVRVAPIRSTQT